MSQKNVWNYLYKKGLSWNLESKIPHICKNKIVLELGVGTGKTLKSILKQKPKSVYAIDFSKEAIKICKSQFKDNKIKFKEADLMSLPYKENYFDIIIAHFVLNNLNKKEISNAIIEIKRILKPRGKIIFEDFSSGDYRQYSYKNNTSKEKRYCHFFTFQEIKSIFSKFKTLSIKISEHSPIRNSKDKKRRIISAVFEKTH